MRAIDANPLELMLFGSPTVRRQGQIVTGFRSSKAQALLYYLAVTGRAHTRPTLAGLLWGDQPEAAARVSLSKCLSNLHELVGDAILIDRQNIAFNREQPYQLDTECFTNGVGNPPTPATAEALQAALALYQGDFLEGFYVRAAPDFEQWVLVQRAHYREAVINGLHTLAGYAEQQGDLPAAITHTRRLLTLEPWCEEAHRQLMTQLARNGQRSVALAQYLVCCQVLDEELGVEPDRATVTLYEQIRDDKGWSGPRARRNEERIKLPPTDPLPVIQAAPRLVVPAVATPLIGRQRELTELCDLLINPDCRLITLFGPGGIGKTRLALAAGAEARVTAAFPQGTVFVALAGVTAATFVPTTILDTLGVERKGGQSAEQQLLTWLRPQRLLLVLDNYEQLLPDVTLLLDILQSAPQVTLLVTARERLQLQAEWLLTLTGLAYPPIRPLIGQQKADDADEHTYAALELFWQRVRQLHHHFAPDAAERQAISQICQLTEGIPLALELAAGAARFHTCTQIAADLARGQPLTTLPMRDRPARQQTMAATFDYSWRLLSAAEQKVLRQLALFRGGFDGAAAQAVADASLPVLLALRDKSLLQQHQTPAGTERYLVQELVRQSAEQKLQAAAEAGATSRRHADYFLQLSETAAHQVHGPAQKDWLRRLQGEQDNLRAALTYLAQADVQQALRLAVALAPFWRRWGQQREGSEWLGVLRQASQPVWPEYAWALMWAGSMARHLQKHAEGIALLEQSQALFQAQGNADGVAQTLRHLGWIYYSLDSARSQQCFEQSLAIFRTQRNQQRIAQVLVDLGQLAIEAANYPLAGDYLQESLALSQEVGDLYTRVLALLQLTSLHELEARYADAAPLYDEAILLCQALDAQPLLATLFFSLAGSHWLCGRYAEARAAAEQSCLLTRRLGGQPIIALHHLALAEFSLGDLARAKQHFAEALQINYNDDRRRMIAICLVGLGAVAGQEQDWQRAVRLFAAADALFATLPPFLTPIDLQWQAEQRRFTQMHCTDAFFTTHWQIGATLPLAQVVAYALSVE